MKVASGEWYSTVVVAITMYVVQGHGAYLALFVTIISHSITQAQTVCSVPTTGGNGGGADCVFPFTFGGEVYNQCHATGGVSNVPWCAITDNWDDDGLWGNCIIKTNTGAICVFPFIYEGTSYRDCTTAANQPEPWCATVDILGSILDTDDWGVCDYQGVCESTIDSSSTPTSPSAVNPTTISPSATVDPPNISHCLVVDSDESGTGCRVCEPGYFKMVGITGAVCTPLSRTCGQPGMSCHGTDLCLQATCARYPGAYCHCRLDVCGVFFTRTLSSGRPVLANCDHSPESCSECSADPCATATCVWHPDAECHWNPCTCEVFFTRVRPNGRVKIANCGRK